MPTNTSFDTSASDIEVWKDVGPFVLINKAIAWVIIITFLLSVFFIFYGGISFILSGGKEDKIKKAIGTIRYAIIGLIITLLATTIISIIGKIFGYNFIGDIINFQQIFSDIGVIIDTFTGGGGGSGIGGSL